MVKKLVTSGLLLIWISSLALAGYRLFEPKAAESVVDNKVSTATIDGQGKTVEDSTVVTQILPEVSETPESEETEEVPTDTKHYYYICSDDDSDCIYINDYVLKPLAETLEVDTISSIEYVDVSTLTDWTPARMKNQWGVDNFPAFVAVSVDLQGNQSILSTLQWDSINPLSTDSLKNWMIENGIWTGPLEEQAIPLEKPAS